MKQKKRIILYLAIFQIFLMISLSFADSYQISKFNDDENSFEISDLKEFKFIKKNFSFLVGLFSIKQIGLVSAESAMGCCVQMPNNGAKCQPILAAIGNLQCPGNYLPYPCEQSTECQSGCCISKSEGNCQTNSPKSICEANPDGVWTNDVNCELPECNKGCCLVFNQANFETQNECKKRSGLYGVEMDFRQIPNELECLSIPTSEFEGACLTDNGNVALPKNCQFVTQSTCDGANGEFHEGVLCSYFEEQTGCEKQKSASCADGKDGIYWYDSCGNRENIYEGDNPSQRDSAWHKGKVKTDNICGPVGGSENPPENCGNCNRARGSICSPVEKSSEDHINGFLYTCKNLNCDVSETEDEEWLGKNFALNGERWCAYDGPIGNKSSIYSGNEFATDTVGSRHWVRYCQEGEVKVEPCQDYRAEVCQSTVIQDESNKDIKFSTASCVPNEAEICISYNVERDQTKELCGANPQCFIKRVHVSDDFEFEMCVPKYPKGGNETVGQTFCSMANLKCPMIYEKNEKGELRCVKNCECKSPDFAQQMNDLCVSLGDCGAYVNWQGIATKNIATQESDNVVLKDFEDFFDGEKKQQTGYNQNTIYEQKVTPIGISELFGGRDKDTSVGADATLHDDEKNQLALVAGISGASGIGALGITLAYGGGVTSAQGTIYMPLINAYGFGTNWIGSIVGPFASAAVGFAIFSIMGSFLARGMGLSGAGAKALIYGSGFFGAGASMLTYALLVGVEWAGWTGGITGGLAAIFIAYVLATGWGKTEVREVSFQCLPWQAPTTKPGAEGDKQCEVCSQDPLRPCSEYKCQSLGKACKLLNSDSDHPICIFDNRYDANPPYIIPDKVWNISSELNITGESSEYKFDDWTGNVGDNEVTLKKINDDGCIQEFYPVVFTLLTQKQQGSEDGYEAEAAQCKWSFNKRPSPMPLDNLLEDWQYPLEQNLYTFNHTFIIYMPSLSSLSAEQIENTETLNERYANLNIFVSCQDANGNFNINDFAVDFCVNNGPDMTAVDHTLTSFNPDSGSYVPVNETEQNLTMWVNEPADCKWDSKQGIEYGSMTNEFECEDSALNIDGLLGYKCTTLLTDINKTEGSKFYIKCRDQPLEDETKRNTNQEDLVYELKSSESELKIDETLPTGEVKINGMVQATVDLEVQTSGGATGDGVSICEFKWNNRWIPFAETDSNNHKQSQFTLFAGNYEIPIRCTDAGRNVAESSLNFKVLIDNHPPQIVRIYSEDGNLKLITDEEASCYFNNFNRCNPFNEANATLMTSAAGGFSTQHSTLQEIGKTYYIKCKDQFFIWNPDCTIVRPTL